VLVEQVFCRMGVPVALISDRGKEVDGQLMKEVCRLMNVDKVRTTAYKVSTNAAVERYHRTLNSLIGRTIEENQREWDSLLPYVMAAYRSSTHESTRYSPNYLTFGREVRAPADLVYGTPPDSVPTSFDSYAEKIETRMKQSYMLVREQLGVAAQRNKHTYDLRVRPARYKVGDWYCISIRGNTGASKINGDESIQGHIWSSEYRALSMSPSNQARRRKRF